MLALCAPCSFLFMLGNPALTDRDAEIKKSNKRNKQRLQQSERYNQRNERLRRTKTERRQRFTSLSRCVHSLCMNHFTYSSVPSAAGCISSNMCTYKKKQKRCSPGIIQTLTINIIHSIVLCCPS